MRSTRSGEAIPLEFLQDLIQEDVQYARRTQPSTDIGGTLNDADVEVIVHDGGWCERILDKLEP